MGALTIRSVLITFGYLGIGVMVFAESGFLLGLFLPGDSLLFTAGLLASQKFFSIWYLMPIVILAAIFGDSFGYWSGRYFGPKIFTKEDSFFFRKRYVEQTRAFYDRHGKKTIILARFAPIVRTIAPILAGVGQMPYRQFLTYNVIGGLFWGGGITLLGYFLGAIFPATEKYLSLIIIVIVVVSFLPIVLEVWREQKTIKTIKD